MLCLYLIFCVHFTCCCAFSQHIQSLTSTNVVVLWWGLMWTVFGVRGFDPDIRTGSQVAGFTCPSHFFTYHLIICSISRLSGYRIRRSVIHKVVHNSDSLQVHRSTRVNEGMLLAALHTLQLLRTCMMGTLTQLWLDFWARVHVFFNYIIILLWNRD